MASNDRVGVFFCHAGTGRLDGLDPAALLDFARQLPEVALAETVSGEGLLELEGR